MRQLTVPGEAYIATFGTVRIQAVLTVDGGVTLTVWSGPSRHDAVSFSYSDRALARRRYAEIAQLAATGLTAEQIDAHVHGQGNAAIDAVRQILAEVARHVAADPSAAAGRLAVALTDAYADLDTAAERAELAALADRINDDLDGCTPMPAPRSFRELRDRHAAAMAREQSPRHRPAA